MEHSLLDYVALGVLIFVVLTIIYGIIYIHDIPYEMAKKREHPHQDAIHVAGWVSLFLMHTIWPFLWIWAALYKPDGGWNMHTPKKDEPVNNINDEIIDNLKNEISDLKERLCELEKQKNTEEN